MKTDIADLGNGQGEAIIAATNSSGSLNVNTDKRLLNIGSATDQKSKSELLVCLMSQTEIFDKVGAAWPLFMRLILTKDGRLMGTHDDIAKQCGNISKDTVRAWVKRLTNVHIVEANTEGWQVTVKLTGVYMDVARAPESIQVSSQVLPPERGDDVALRMIREGTRELGGTMTITINCDVAGI